MIDPGHVDIVKHQISIIGNPFLGNHKQGDPPDTCGGPLDLDQHQVDDIFRAVVISCRDEDLLTPYPVVSLSGGFGLGGDIRQGTSRLRFGQGHGPLPFSGKHPGDKSADEFLGAEGLD